MRFVVLFAFVNLITCFDVVPLVVASHRLVKGLKSELTETKLSTRHNGQEVTNLLKKLITGCSSDEYLLLDMPGLRYSDMNDYKFEDWPFLAKLLSMSSSLVGLPFVNDLVDLDYINEYVINTCDAEDLYANVEDENSIDYMDIKTKVINIKFDKLVLDPEDRIQQIRKNDDFIRKIIQKLPSPHYTIILTSSIRTHVEPAPSSAFNNNPSTFGVFNKIINDERRAVEVELNDRFNPVPPQWNQNRHTNNRYEKNKKKDQIKLMDYELWVKNEKIIMTLVMMVMTIVMIKMKGLFNYLTEPKPKLD